MANQCCQELLAKIAELYHTTPEEILAKLEADTCHFVYKRNTKTVQKGTRCSSKVYRDGYVFCERHHKGSIKPSSVEIGGPRGIVRERYVPQVGLVELASKKNIQTIKMIQGDASKLNLLPMLDHKFKAPLEG